MAAQTCEVKNCGPSLRTKARRDFVVSKEPSLRVRAWRAVAVSVTNEAIRRQLFKLESQGAGFPEEPAIRLNTEVKIDGRLFTLWIEDAGFSVVRLEVIAVHNDGDRGRRAAWYVERRNGLWIQRPRRAFEPMSGFSRAEQAELATMPVEPTGYGFTPVEGEK